MLPFYDFVFLLYSAGLCNIVVVKTPKPNYKKDFFLNMLKYMLIVSTARISDTARKCRFLYRNKFSVSNTFCIIIKYITVIAPGASCRGDMCEIPSKYHLKNSLDDLKSHQKTHVGGGKGGANGQVVVKYFHVSLSSRQQAMKMCAFLHLATRCQYRAYKSAHFTF